MALELSILVADDNTVNLSLIEYLLEELGHNVTLVENGLEAVEVFKVGQWDLVLMDVHMPKLDGLDATSQIRAWEAEQARSPVPVYALTAETPGEGKHRYAAAGMNGYLSKPIDEDKLASVLSQLSNGSSATGS